MSAAAASSSDFGPPAYSPYGDGERAPAPPSTVQEMERLQAQIRQLQLQMQLQQADINAQAPAPPTQGVDAAAIATPHARLPHIAARHRRMVWALLIAGVLPSFALLIVAAASDHWADGSAPIMPDVFPYGISFYAHWGLFKACYSHNKWSDHQGECAKRSDCIAFDGKCVWHSDSHDNWTVNDGNPLLDNNNLRTVLATMMIALLATFLMVCGVGADMFMWARGLGQEFGKTMVFRVYYTMIGVWISAAIALVVCLPVWSVFVDELKGIYTPSATSYVYMLEFPQKIHLEWSFTLVAIATGLLIMSLIGILVRIGLAKRDKMEHDQLLQQNSNSQAQAAPAAGQKDAAIQLAALNSATRPELATNISYDSTCTSPQAASTVNVPVDVLEVTV